MKKWYELWEDLKKVVVEKTKDLTYHHRLILHAGFVEDPAFKKVSHIVELQTYDWVYILGAGASEKEAILKAIETIKKDKKTIRTPRR